MNHAVANGAQRVTLPGDPAVTTLIAHIHDREEKHLAAIARELHDEFGGLLVGALMDIAWVAQRAAALPPDARAKLARAQQTLGQAVDRKRKLVEDLHPSLLDNVGLFATLQWRVDDLSTRAGVPCELELPREEPALSKKAGIAVYRIADALLELVTAGQPSLTVLKVSVEGGEIVMTVSTPDRLEPAGGEMQPPDAAGECALASVLYRVRAYGGQFSSHANAIGLGVAEARFPLHLLQQEKQA